MDQYLPCTVRLTGRSPALYFPASTPLFRRCIDRHLNTPTHITDDPKSTNERGLLDAMRELFRRAGEHLRIPRSSRRASRSTSPAPSVGSETAAHNRESLVVTESTPALTPAPCLKPLTTIEISQRTYEHLKEKLSNKELGELKWATYSGTTAEKYIADLKEKLKGHQQGAQKMNNILLHVNKYCTIVDVAIQHQPDITALVWAGARTVIQVRKTSTTTPWPNSNANFVSSWRLTATRP